MLIARVSPMRKLAREGSALHLGQVLLLPIDLQNISILTFQRMGKSLEMFLPPHNPVTLAMHKVEISFTPCAPTSICPHQPMYIRFMRSNNIKKHRCMLSVDHETAGSKWS